MIKLDFSHTVQELELILAGLRNPDGVGSRSAQQAQRRGQKAI